MEEVAPQLLERYAWVVLFTNEASNSVDWEVVLPVVLAQVAEGRLTRQ